MSRGIPERLARASATRPWLTVAAWLAAVVLAMVVIALFLGSALTARVR